MKNYSFDNSYDLYRALRDASPAERLNIVKQANLDLLDDDDWTVLMLAAKYGQTAIVDSLIKAGANKDIQDNDGWTALMYAAYNGREYIVDSLIKAGANKDIKNKYGRTALMLAAKHGYEDIVDLLSTPHQLIKDIKQKLAESEQKIANLTKQVDKYKEPKVLNDFLAKKREKRLLGAIRLGRFRGCK